MPIYAYRCEACGHAKDVLRKVSDPLLSTCPSCGAEAFKKQLTAAGFQLKGSGWYVTDFRGDAKAGKPAGDAEAGAAAKGDLPKDGAGKGDAAQATGAKGDQGKADTGKAEKGKTEPASAGAKTSTVTAPAAAPASGGGAGGAGTAAGGQ